MRPDHWIHQELESDHDEPVPLFRCGTRGVYVGRVDEGRSQMLWSADSEVLEEKLKSRICRSIKRCTAWGKDMDFDPDALVLELMNELRGYRANLGRVHAPETK